VQNKILWFYPRAEPEHWDVLQRKRPPYIKEIDDPSVCPQGADRRAPQHRGSREICP